MYPLTGRYQIHTGMQHKIVSQCTQNGLPLKEKTIADKLKEVGYKTHIVGELFTPYPGSKCVTSAWCGVGFTQCKSLCRPTYVIVLLP